LFSFLCSVLNYLTHIWVYPEYFAEIKADDLLSSLEHVYGVNSIEVDTFSLPNLPVPPNDFTGIRKKVSSLRRWFAICADDAAK